MIRTLYHLIEIIYKPPLVTLSYVDILGQKNVCFRFPDLPFFYAPTLTFFIPNPENQPQLVSTIESLQIRD